MAKKPQQKQPTFKNADRKIPTSVIVAVVVLLVALAAIIISIVSLSGDKTDGDVSNASSAGSAVPESSEASEAELLDIHALESYSESYAYVQMDVKGFGTILLELDPSAAPITVANFTKLVGSGFYDGLTFHRIISGFMIQGGDPLGNGTGGSKETIKGEFASNGWDNPIKHTRGVISMARSSAPDSASSQFFIVHQTSPHLDGQYAAFGRVVAGMDVVDAIASVSTGVNDRPITDVVIDRALLLQDAPKA